MGLKVGLDGFGEENTVLPVAQSLYRLSNSGCRLTTVPNQNYIHEEIRSRLDSGNLSGCCCLPVPCLHTERSKCNSTELNQNSALLTLPRRYPLRNPAEIPTGPV